LKEKELHINIEYAKAQIDRSSLRKIPA
jgi:hypothetical protein